MSEPGKSVNYVHIAIDALFDCPKVFTKEDLIASLEKKEMRVIDIDSILFVFLDNKTIIPLEDGRYQVDMKGLYERLGRIN